MTELQLQNLFLLLHKPIPWDPIPWWFSLDKERVAKFNEVQTKLNTQIATIQAEKVRDLAGILNMPIK